MLRPLTKVVRFLWSVTAVLTAGATAWFAITGAIGSQPVCFRTGLPPDGHGSSGILHPDVTSSVEQALICLQQPTGGERVVAFLTTAPTAFGYAITLLLLLLLLERASRDGVHTAATAAGLKRFGVFVLVALPAVTLVEAFAAGWLLQRATSRDVEATAFLSDWDLPWWAVVTGVGLLTLAKIVRTSAEMREDLEGTV